MTKIKSQRPERLTDCNKNVSNSRTKEDSHSHSPVHNVNDEDKKPIEINVKDSIILFGSNNVDSIFNGGLNNLVTKIRIKQKQSGSGIHYGRRIAQILKKIFYSIW